jgi:choline kinase
VSRAIILAAGSGSRLRPLTADLPKCLLEVGGRTLLDHQLDALARCGITDVVAVVGFRGDKIRQQAGTAVRYIENERFAATNSLYSLWLAREELTKGFCVMNSDVLAPPRLFERLLTASAPDGVLVELGHDFEPEDMKVTLVDGRVVDFGKGLPSDRAQAHNVGVAKFSPEGAAVLTRCLDRLVASGHENDWAPAAFREFAGESPLAAVATDGLPWIEIDYPADLARARAEVGPAIAALDHVASV